MNADKIKIEFGLLLKQLRKEKGVSQEQLAHDSSLDRTYISMLERGIYQPSLETIFALTKSLNISPSVLVSTLEERLKKQSN